MALKRKSSRLMEISSAGMSGGRRRITALIVALNNPSPFYLNDYK
jgi:hypothetical protein